MNKLSIREQSLILFMLCIVILSCGSLFLYAPLTTGIKNTLVQIENLELEKAQKDSVIFDKPLTDNRISLVASKVGVREHSYLAKSLDLEEADLFFINMANKYNLTTRSMTASDITEDGLRLTTFLFTISGDSSNMLLFLQDLESYNYLVITRCLFTYGISVPNDSLTLEVVLKQLNSDYILAKDSLPFGYTLLETEYRGVDIDS